MSMGPNIIFLKFENDLHLPPPGSGAPVSRGCPSHPATRALLCSGFWGAGERGAHACWTGLWERSNCESHLSGFLPTGPFWG